MTSVSKKIYEIKHDLVLITIFAGTQANAYNQTHFYNVAIWTFCVYTRYWQLIQSINLQVGTCIRYLFNDPCLPTPKPMHTTKLILDGSAIINQSINLQVQR